MENHVFYHTFNCSLKIRTGISVGSVHFVEIQRNNLWNFSDLMVATDVYIE